MTWVDNNPQSSNLTDFLCYCNIFIEDWEFNSSSRAVKSGPSIGPVVCYVVMNYSSLFNTKNVDEEIYYSPKKRRRGGQLNSPDGSSWWWWGLGCCPGGNNKNSSSTCDVRTRPNTGISSVASGARVDHSHWSSSVEILCSDWLRSLVTAI